MPKAPSDGLRGCDFSSHLAGPCVRHSVNEGFVPSRWKKANVVVPPALKVQPPRLVESVLRPISLTATLVKVLESFAGSWIVERVGDKIAWTTGSSAPSYSGQPSTAHALADMLHHYYVLRRRQRRVCTYIRTAFVDFAKAFDHVDHNVLVAKLVSLGLPDVIVRWMCAFLRQQQQRED